MRMKLRLLIEAEQPIRRDDTKRRFNGYTPVGGAVVSDTECL